MSSPTQPAEREAVDAARDFLEDRALAAAILERDRKATARLVELHADAVHRYVWKRLSPRIEMVDDLVQEVFLAAWTGLPGYAGTAPLRHWLLGIARNKVEDHYRRTLNARWQSLEVEGDAQLPATSADLAGQLDSRRNAERAGTTLARLPYEYALVLRWRYWDERSVREMAAAAGRTEKAMERLLARARARFRTLWEEGA